SPDEAEIAQSLATYQLLSPGAGDATAASCSPSGDQSYSWMCKPSGEVEHTRPDSTSRMVSRCAGTFLPTSPSSGGAACVGPVGRSAPSLCRTASRLSSGD